MYSFKIRDLGTGRAVVIKSWESVRKREKDEAEIKGNNTIRSNVHGDIGELLAITTQSKEKQANKQT